MRSQFLFSGLTSVVLFLFSLHTHAQAGEWTWMKGSSSSNSMGSFGTMGIPDASNNPPALYEAYEWTDKQGNLWLFGGDDGTYSLRSALWKFNPSSNEWTWINGSS